MNKIAALCFCVFFNTLYSQTVTLELTDCKVINNKKIIIAYSISNNSDTAITIYKPNSRTSICYRVVILTGIDKYQKKYNCSDCTFIMDLDHIKLTDFNTTTIEPNEKFVDTLFHSFRYWQKIKKISLKFTYGSTNFRGDYPKFFRHDLISNEIEIVRKRR